jgi:hypothetical protein
MNDKTNAQASPATPDSNDKTPPVNPDCCTAPPGGGDPGPGGPTG